MNLAELFLGAVLVIAVLRDAFLGLLVPRTVANHGRFSSRFLRLTWTSLSIVVKRGSKREEGWLASFGPLSVIMLLVCWATFLIVGFALISKGAGVVLQDHSQSFRDYLYLSGVTFLTLGQGDLFATSPLGRMFTVAEAGVGLAFLAIVVSYLPVLYGLFSKRESLIILMDARAGSPPSGGEMIRRFADKEDWDGLCEWFAKWEQWSA